MTQAKKGLLPSLVTVSCVLHADTGKLLPSTPSPPLTPPKKSPTRTPLYTAACLASPCHIPQHHASLHSSQQNGGVKRWTAACLDLCLMHNHCLN